MFRILLAQNNKSNIMVIKNALINKTSEIEYIEIPLSVNDIVGNVEMLKPDMLFISCGIDEDTCFSAMEELKEKKLFGKETKNGKNLYIVVISKFDNYDVVRNVFKLGADDCLIEPLNRNAIVDVVEDVMEKVLSDKIKHFQKEVSERKKSEYDVLSEHTLFYNVMFNEDFEKIASNLGDFEDLEEKGFVVTFEIRDLTDYEYLDYIDFQKNLRNRLKKKMKLKMGPMINGRLCVYIKCENSYLSDKVKLNNLLYWTGKEISDLLTSELRGEVYAGVGGVYPIKNICTSYEESLRALIKGESVNVYKENKEKLGGDFRFYKDCVKKLMESIDIGSKECYGHFSRVLDSVEHLEDDEKFDRILLILTFVTCTIKKHSLYEDNITLYVEELKKNFELKHEDINTWAIKRFDNLIQSEKNYSLKEYSGYVSFCVDYIYSNYRKEIVLKEVANMCGVSMQYLSKVFREEAGMSFVDFLNNYRINKAKELMKKSNISIKEVCYAVGYNDPNYFSRIFKKNTGKTPREYISKYNKHINNTD